VIKEHSEGIVNGGGGDMDEDAEVGELYNLEPAQQVPLQLDAAMEDGSTIPHPSGNIDPHIVRASSIAQPDPQEPQPSAASQAGLAGAINMPHSVLANGKWHSHYL
jgi:hypothetical protein